LKKKKKRLRTAFDGGASPPIRPQKMESKRGKKADSSLKKKKKEIENRAGKGVSAKREGQRKEPARKAEKWQKPFRKKKRKKSRVGVGEARPERSYLGALRASGGGRRDPAQGEKPAESPWPVKRSDEEKKALCDEAVHLNRKGSYPSEKQPFGSCGSAPTTVQPSPKESFPAHWGKNIFPA